LNITPAVADWRRRNEIEGNMATRRQILIGGIGAAAAVGLYRFFYRVPRVDAATFEISHTDDEWQKLLTPAQYDVLRRSGTEARGRASARRAPGGHFPLRGLRPPLFSSTTKFESGRGGCFWAPIRRRS
jgi:peptide-methionine (R)-S-oxide reductase